MPLEENTKKLLELVFSYDCSRTANVVDRKLQLAYYTTAETAMKVIKGRSLWLRNAGLMNDYSEIEYGKNVMAPVVNGPLGDRLRLLLDAVKPGMAGEVMRRHEVHRGHAREAVFTASVSEHDPNDRLGRLSMWRAYGGPVAGVALLFKSDVVDMELDPDLEVSASPVLYGGPDDFHAELEKMIRGLESNIEFLKSSDADILENAVTNLLQFSMFSIKHPGFREEQEWRIIYRPFEFPSDHVLRSTVTVSGIPQAIFELPFHNPERGPLFNLPQLDLNEILEGVVLGPCGYPETIFRAFMDEMAAAGIESPRDRIFVSNIPLRQRW